MILDNLKKAGVQNTVRNERLKFDRLEPYAGEWLHAEGEYAEKDGSTRRGVSEEVCKGLRLPLGFPFPFGQSYYDLLPTVLPVNVWRSPVVAIGYGAVGMPVEHDNPLSIFWLFGCLLPPFCLLLQQYASRRN